MTGSSLSVVGLGMGRPHLAPDVANIVAGADLLVGGERQLTFFPTHTGRRLPLLGPLPEVFDAIEAALAKGEAVVVLADGDPLFFGIGRSLLSRFGPEQLAFYPNITAVATAAARLGRSWHDLPTVSLHGRNDATPLFEALSRHNAAAVYTDARNTPSAIAAMVRARGGDAFRMAILEEMGLPGERIRRLPLVEALPLKCSPLNLVVIERIRPVEQPLTLGMGDDALLRLDAVFTKTPVRAVSLAALAPRPGNVIWDVGAGTGSVALEASLLCPGGAVFAIERDMDRFALLTQNVRRTGALTVAPVCGEAPDVMADLPDPDRIFVGGGLSTRHDMLAVLCDRLRPGGRLVINCVLFSTLQQAMEELTRHGLIFTLTQLQANTTAPLGNDIRLAAENPVFILNAAKEADHA